jgi:hypothetical protein
MREAILARITKNYGINIAELPVKYTKGMVHHRNALLKVHLRAPYIFLYLTSWNNIGMCLYVTYAGVIYSVTMRVKIAGDQLFGGYICDRELLLDDIYVRDGKNVQSNAIELRLKAMNMFVDHNYRHDPVLDVFHTRVLDHVEAKHWRSYLGDYLPLQAYKDDIDGFVIIPLNGDVARAVVVDDILRMVPHKSGVEGSLAIRAPSDNMQTARFMLETTDKPDVYNLYLHDASGKLAFYDIASIPHKTSSKEVMTMINGQVAGQRPEAGIRCPVTCQYDPEFYRWRPVALSTGVDRYEDIFTC